MTIVLPNLRNTGPRFVATLGAGLVAAVLIASQVAAAQITDLAIPPDSIRADYVSCLYASENDPAFGTEKSQAWLEALRADVTAPAEHLFFAEHCIANALYLNQDFEESGLLLERMAERRLITQDEARVDLLVQAGQAFFSAENYVKAIEVQRRAIALRPWSPDMYLDLAYTREALGDNLGVVVDLETAMALDPERADVQVLLASAKRAIQEYDDALRLLDRVILRWPGYPDALLERGIIKRVRGNILDAEADWLLILQMHPNSTAASIALQNLNNL